MAESYQKKIIELMVKQELLLAHLYRLFGDRFPEYLTFWRGLAKEEIHHAELIKKLYRAEKNDQVIFSEGKVKTYTLNVYLESIGAVIMRAENDEFDIKTAAVQVLNLEMGLIEKNFLSHFHIVDQKYKGIMERLETETKNHIKKVRALIATLG